MQYSTFRAFAKAQYFTDRDDRYDDVMYFDFIRFKGTTADALFIAQSFPHLCLDKLRTDDYRMIGIRAYPDGTVEMQGQSYE